MWHELASALVEQQDLGVREPETASGVEGAMYGLIESLGGGHCLGRAVERGELGSSLLLFFGERDVLDRQTQLVRQSSQCVQT